LVPISGIPIASRILILFSIPKIAVGKFFSNSAVEKSKIGIPIPKFEIQKKKKCRNSIHLILQKMSIVICQPVGLTMPNHMDVGINPWQRQFLCLFNIYST
jgi:hypothetical protein